MPLTSLRTLLALAVLAGCATGAHRSPVAKNAIFQGTPPAALLEPARVAVGEVAHPRSVIRVLDDRVLTEGWIGVCGRDVACGEWARGPGSTTGTPWTRIEVRLTPAGSDTAVAVKIRYETRAHCREAEDLARCPSEPLASSGALERAILKRMRNLAGGAPLPNGA